MKAYIISLLLLSILMGCTSDSVVVVEQKTVPHQLRWGIYVLDLSSQDVELIFSSSEAISFLCFNKTVNKFAFSQKVGSTANEAEEIFTIAVDGSNLTRLLNNNFYDLYPVFSPDGSKVLFLSMRDTTLDLYTMNSDGSNVQMLYNSGGHDADPNWGPNLITFTRNSQIWTINIDGTNPQRITNPPNAGQWGNANLPFGDYDPRFNPAGTKIVFERMDDDTSPHGNYNLYLVNPDGTGETRITTTFYSQGLANWSNSGDKLVYIVAAINSVGKYDIYMINSDGTNNRDITPSYFPANFLCHDAMFSADDSKIYFTGEWFSK